MFSEKSLVPLATAIFCGAVFASPIPATAGNPAECAVYANAAVTQNAINLQKQCGYTGLRWLSDYPAHFGWCLGATKAQANAERTARNAMLATCTGGGGQPPNQATYNEPVIGGFRLDWCQYWAAQCGAPAANAYCQTKGYSHATKWALASNIGTFAKTKVIGTGQVCDGPDCDGFAWIACSN